MILKKMMVQVKILQCMREFQLCHTGCNATQDSWGVRWLDWDQTRSQSDYHATQQDSLIRSLKERKHNVPLLAATE